jgi:hypothetical protein
VGLIQWWMYEAMKFRLADNTFYTPDFIVVTANGDLEAHEVKAYWSNANRGGWREDARVKIKVAAEMHPVRFLGMTLMKDGSFEREEFGPSSGNEGTETDDGPGPTAIEAQTEE